MFGVEGAELDLNPERTLAETLRYFEEILLSAARETIEAGHSVPTSAVVVGEGRARTLYHRLTGGEEERMFRQIFLEQVEEIHARAALFLSDTWITKVKEENGKVKKEGEQGEALILAVFQPVAGTRIVLHRYRREGKKIVWEERVEGSELELLASSWNPWQVMH